MIRRHTHGRMEGWGTESDTVLRAEERTGTTTGAGGANSYRLRQTGIHRGGHRRGQGQKHAHPGNSEQKSGKQKIETYMLTEGQNGIDTKL